MFNPPFAEDYMTVKQRQLIPHALLYLPNEEKDFRKGMGSIIHHRLSK
jgi:hypothetical protein